MFGLRGYGIGSLQPCLLFCPPAEVRNCASVFFFNWQTSNQKNARIARYLVKSILYGIWKFRNKCTFYNGTERPDAIIRYIIQDVKAQINIDFFPFFSWLLQKRLGIPFVLNYFRFAGCQISYSDQLFRLTLWLWTFILDSFFSYHHKLSLNTILWGAKPTCFALFIMYFSLFWINFFHNFSPEAR